ncbi:MAG TPA: porin [Gemmatimonadales bacterium]|nr:porin [Gemmatimonadales bacterium]
MSRSSRCFLGFVLAAAASGAPLAAQTTYPSVKINGRLQEHLYYFDNDGLGVGPTSNVLTRRARIGASVQIAENVLLVLQPSFEGGRNLSGSGRLRPDSSVSLSGGRSGFRLRDAYIDVRLTRAEAPTSVTVRFGQEKRPFGRYELISSTNLPSIERGAGAGLLAAASNDLFASAGYLSHDVGASATVAHSLGGNRALTLQAGVYNGQGESLNDVNGAKSFGVRLTVGLVGKLEVGGSVFSHDAVVGADSSARNTAFGIDFQWQKPGDEGLFLVGDFMQGEDRTGTVDMRGLSLVGAYHVRMKRPGAWLYAVEPFARFDYADPDTGTDDDGATLVTAGLGFYVSSRAHFRLAYERQAFEAAGVDAVSGVRSQMAVSF